MTKPERELAWVPARAGGADFELFYQREYPAARQLAWLLTHSDVCDEITQEAFVAVWLVYDNLERPGGYLRRAIVNGCHQYHRQVATRAQRLRLLSPPNPAVAPSADLVDLLARLPYRQRVAIAGRYWAGWSEAEIAAALGCRPGTVKSLTSRALSTLRKNLEAQNDG